MHHPVQLLAIVALTLLVGACGGKPHAGSTTDAGASAKGKTTKPAFRLSNAEPEKVAHAPDVKSEPLPEAETDRLLARLPPLDADDAGVAFALREGSLPAPRPGRVVNDSFPPKPMAPPPTVQNDAKLTVTRHAPDGEVPIAANLSISFSEPMIAVATISAMGNKEVPARVTPPLKNGSWRWLGTQTLVFQPDKELPKATEYVVTIPAGTKSVAGHALEREERFTFATPPVKMVSTFPVGPDQDVEPLVFVELDQAIDRNAILPKVTIKSDGLDYGARLATPGEIAADEATAKRVADAEKHGIGRSLVLRTKTPLAAGANIDVELGVGLPSAEGPRTTKDAQRFSFATHGKFEVKEVECNEYCYPNGMPMLRFTTLLDAAEYDDAMLSIEPAVENFRSRAYTSGIGMVGRFKSGVKYKVRLTKGLKDGHGQHLEQDAVRFFEVHPFPTALHAEQQQMIVMDPDLGPTQLVVRSTNDKNARLRLYRVRPDQWQAFEEFRKQWDYEHKLKTPPGELALDTDLKLDGNPDEITRTLVDLKPALPAGRGHVLAIVESPRPEAPNHPKEWMRQWVQVTSIGISTQSAPVGGLSLYASHLANGTPFPGITFSIAGTDRTALSGPDGIAAFEAPYGGNDGRLVARGPNDDSAFTFGIQQQEAILPGSLALHTFDDRRLYKPGETVKVKGLLRRVGSMKSGDVSLPVAVIGRAVSFEVHDPRDAVIGKGSTKIDEAGGFDVSFKLPQGANLGEAVAIFKMGSEELGMHGFRIDEFRRPEYEVKADASPGPHVVGGFGVVTVKGSYYAGGGLAATKTDWQVTQSHAHFQPPNRSDYHFGRTSVPWWRTDDDAEVKTVPWESRTDTSGTHRLRIDFDGTAEPYPFSLSASATLTDVNRQAWASTTSLLVHPARVSVGVRTDKPYVRAGDAIELHLVAVDPDGNFVKGRKIQVRSYRAVAKQVKGEWVTQELDESRCDFVSTDGDAKACQLATKAAGLHKIVADVTDENGKKSRTAVDIWAAGKTQGADRSVRSGSIELTADKKQYQPGDTAEILVRVPFAPSDGMVDVRGGTVTRRMHVHLDERIQAIKVPIDPTDRVGVQLTMTLAGNEPRLDEHGDPDPKEKPRPVSARGVLSLEIPPDDAKIVLKVRAERPAVAPGEKDLVLIDAATAKGEPHPAELAVIVVDESVLALAGYQLVNPLGLFHRPVGAYVNNYDNRGMVLLDSKQNDFFVDDPFGGGLFNGFAPGGLGLSGIGEGGGGGGFGYGHGRVGGIGLAAASASVAARAPPSAAESIADKATTSFGYKAREASTGSMPTTPIAMRTNFDALALFATRVATDAAGHAEVPVAMPESTSRFRVMVVAWDKANHFGSGESSITTRQPLIVRPSAPRFLNYGDRFELPIVVQNQTEEKKRVAVAGRAANAAFDSKQGRIVEIPAGDRVEVRLPARTIAPGKARVQVGVASGDFADAASIEVPVWSPATTEAFATYGTIDEGAVAQAITVPEGVEKGFGGLDISTSSTALFALTDAFLYIQRYPFDCNEQVASRILSIAALGDALAAFNAPGLPSKEAQRLTVQKDLAVLQSRQDSSGGFGFWARDPWPFLSAHVGLALATARAKHFAVDGAMLDRLISYLEHIEGHFPKFYPKEARLTTQALALHVLRKLDRADPKRARKLVDEFGGIEKAPIEALALVLPTLEDDPGAGRDLARAITRHFANRATETAGAAHFTTDYGESSYLVLASSHRTDAMVLGALIETDPKSDLLPKVVEGLLGGRRAGHWGTTQEDAFVLLALDAYFHKFENVTPNFMARVWLGGRGAAEHAFRGRNTDRAEVSIPMALLPEAAGGAPGAERDLIVGKDGPGRLYYRLGLRYAPSSLTLPALERGFTVTRRYEPAGKATDVRRDEQGVWHVKAGATVRVRVSMVAPSERHHVALVDPLPGGFEALNDALGGTPPAPIRTDDSAAEDRRSSGLLSWWWWRSTWYEHDNLRDERAEAFASVLPAGVYEYVYTARATTPGTFVSPPPKAEEMYSPETFGRGPGEKLVIEAVQ